MIKEPDPMERAENEDEQCQAQISSGQCLMKALPGATMCQIHNGYKQIQKAERESLYQFHRSAFLSSDQAKQEKFKYDLSAELGMSRVMLQKFMDKMVDFESMMQYNSQAMVLIDRIQKLSDSVLKADQKLGSLMSEDDAFALAQGLIDVVHEVLTKHIPNDTQFAEAMQKAGDSFSKVLAQRGEDKS